jgi:hypothetical protein
MGLEQGDDAAFGAVLEAFEGGGDLGGVVGVIVVNGDAAGLALEFETAVNSAVLQQSLADVLKAMSSSRPMLTACREFWMLWRPVTFIFTRPRR